MFCNSTYSSTSSLEFQLSHLYLFAYYQLDKSFCKVRRNLSIFLIIILNSLPNIHICVISEAGSDACFASSDCVYVLYCTLSMHWNFFFLKARHAVSGNREYVKQNSHVGIYDNLFNSWVLFFLVLAVVISVCAKLLQSCLTLCYPMDCSLPVSSVHGILQARILEWVAIPFSRGSSWCRDQTHISYVSWIGRWVLYH